MSRRGFLGTRPSAALCWRGSSLRWPHPSLLGENRDYGEYLPITTGSRPILGVQLHAIRARFPRRRLVHADLSRSEYEYFVLMIAGLSLGIKFFFSRNTFATPLLASSLFALFSPTHEYTRSASDCAWPLAISRSISLYERRYFCAALWFVLASVPHQRHRAALRYLAARYVRGNTAVILIGVGAAILFYVSDRCAKLIVSLFSASIPCSEPIGQSHLRIGQPAFDK